MNGPSISTSAFRALAHSLQFSNVSSEAIEEINQSAKDMDKQVSAYEFYTAWHKALKLTDKPILGLESGICFHPGNLGVIGWAMLNCRTTGDALRLFFRYQQLGDSSLKATLDESGDDAVITIENIHYDCEFTRPWVEALTSGYIGVFHQLTNNKYVAVSNYKSVSFNHKPACPIEEYKKILNCPVYFEQKETKIVLNKQALALNVLMADGHALSALVDKIPETGLKSGESDTLDNLKKYLSVSMVNGLPSLDDAACYLNISPSTLKRKLASEGSSFRDLIQSLRLNLSIRLLKLGTTPLTEIAYEIGFSSSTAFSRAFKEWTGLSPSGYLKQCHSGELQPCTFEKADC